MFERPWHRHVLAVLESFDAERLVTCGFSFGGGTRIVLDLGEYRESHDIDFLASDAAGYADLRAAVREDRFQALFTPKGLERLSFPREARMDQYGIRFPVVHDGATLKVELIREGRIGLDPPMRPPWSPVACLSREDCWTEKLLANSDRWPDRQLLARDLVDLAAMRRHWGEIPPEAWERAEGAYKAAPRKDLRKALEQFLADAEFRQRCFEGLAVSEIGRGELVEALETLGDAPLALDGDPVDAE